MRNLIPAGHGDVGRATPNKELAVLLFMEVSYMLIDMAHETKIKTLSIHVANKIAAGEVVERPASVLKELVENALDAAATQVDVAVITGGRRLISVSDNGHGMNRDDALLCIKSHTTSKIQDVNDIECINTFGFRGEALAAIASVSRFKLRTCATEANGGTEVTTEGGKSQNVCDAGCPIGTSIEVHNLFFNVPARRKFLRTHQTELAHLRSEFMVQSLGCPRVGFCMNVDEREIYRLSGGGKLEDRLRDLFGPEYSENLIPIHQNGDYLTISGYISKPAWSRADRAEQFVFVNGRATSAAVIGFAIKEAYRSCMPENRHPATFLYLELNPRHVDVNVHPTKKEVRFRNPREVRDSLVSVMENALSGNRVPGRIKVEQSELKQRPGGVEIQMRIENLPEAPMFKYPSAKRVVMDAQGMAFAPLKEDASEFVDAVIDKDEVFDSPWAWCRIIGLIGGQFVVMETEDGYVIMDPHAAHERVLYERFLRNFSQDKIFSQSLLTPETVELQPGDAMRVRKHIDLLQSMGFGVSEFGGGTFVIDAMPSCFSDSLPNAILVEIATEIEMAGVRKGKEHWREEAVARAVSYVSVRSQDRLKLKEIEQLVIDLSQTKMPYTCPRGRPTLIFTSFKELCKKFGRKTPKKQTP